MLRNWHNSSSTLFNQIHTPMLSAGKNVKSATEPLIKVQERYVYDAIRSPKPELATLLRQLRTVRRINAAEYRTQKVRLPYIVCAMFNPPYRRTENFAYTESFIIDIDHIADKGLIYDDLLQNHLCRSSHHDVFPLAWRRRAQGNDAAQGKML